MTLAQLKRDAKAMILRAEMIEWFGSTEIPENLQGIRKIVDSNSVGLMFQSTDGNISELPIERASLIEYTGDTLTVYRACLREMNEEERAVMNEWMKIASADQYKEQSMRDSLTDGSSTYYQEKAFFDKSKYPYLFGTESRQGKRLDLATNKIIDSSIKGEVTLKYKIYKG